MPNTPSDNERSGDDEPSREELLAENRRNRELIRDEEERKRRKGGGADQLEREWNDDGPDADDGEAGTSARGGVHGRRTVGALVALALVLAAAVGVLGYLLAAHGSDGEGLDRAGVIRDAKKYASEVLTYHSGDYADLDRRIRAIATPEFADRYIASSQQARKANDEAQASSKATAEVAGIVSISDDHAVVLVALDQKVTSPQAPALGRGDRAYQSRIEVDLTRADGEWRISDLDAV